MRCELVTTQMGSVEDVCVARALPKEGREPAKVVGAACFDVCRTVLPTWKTSIHD